MEKEIIPLHGLVDVLHIFCDGVDGSCEGTYRLGRLLFRLHLQFAVFGNAETRFENFKSFQTSFSSVLSSPKMKASLRVLRPAADLSAKHVVIGGGVVRLLAPSRSLQATA